MLVDAVIHFPENFSGYDVPVIVRPSPNFGVQGPDQGNGGHRSSITDRLGDIIRKCPDVAFRGFYQEFSPVLPAVIPPWGVPL